MHAALLPFGSRAWSDQRLIYLCRLATVTIPCLVFLLLRVGRARSESEAAVWIALGVGSLLYTQALSFTGHLPAGILLLIAYERLRDSPERAGLGVGALAGLAITLDYLAALPILGLLIYGLFRGASLRIWSLRLAGCAIPVAALLAYHWICFGGPFELAYGHMVVAAHQANRARGFFGATWPDPGVVWALLFGGDRGLFFHSPLLLGAVFALFARLRGIASRAEAATTLSLFLLVVGFNASLGDWQGGWGVGPRYLALVVPLLAAAFAPWACALPDRLRPLAIGAAAWGALLHVLAIATFPLPPFAGPLRVPALELGTYLLERGLVAWNPAFLVGVRGVLSIAPLFAALAALAVVLLRRRDVPALVLGAIAFAGVSSVLAATRSTESAKLLATFPQRAGYTVTPVTVRTDRPAATRG